MRTNTKLIFLMLLLAQVSMADELSEFDLSGVWQFSGIRNGIAYNHEVVLQKSDFTLDLYGSVNEPYYLCNFKFDTNREFIGMMLVESDKKPGEILLVGIQRKHYIGPQEGWRLDDETFPIIDSTDDMLILGKNGKESARMVRIKTVHGPSTAIDYEEGTSEL